MPSKHAADVFNHNRNFGAGCNDFWDHSGNNLESSLNLQQTMALKRRYSKETI